MAYLADLPRTYVRHRPALDADVALEGLWVSTTEATDVLITLGTAALGAGSVIASNYFRSRVPWGKAKGNVSPDDNSQRIDELEEDIKQIGTTLKEALIKLQEARECAGRYDERLKSLERSRDSIEKSLERIFDRLEKRRI